MSWSLYHGERDPTPIVLEAGWAPGLVWMGVENFARTSVRSPDCPAGREPRSSPTCSLPPPARTWSSYCWRVSGVQSFCHLCLTCTQILVVLLVTHLCSMSSLRTTIIMPVLIMATWPVDDPYLKSHVSRHQTVAMQFKYDCLYHSTSRFKILLLHEKG